MPKEIKKESKKYFVCSRIKALLSNDNCEFNQSKEKQHANILCKECPLTYRNKRFFYSQEEILEGKHTIELEIVLLIDRKLASPNKTKTEQLENLDVLNFML